MRIMYCWTLSGGLRAFPKPFFPVPHPKWIAILYRL
jgi:hypothetical protein